VYHNDQRGILNINSPNIPDPQLVQTVLEILKHGNPDAQSVLLPLLASLPDSSPWTKQEEVAEAVRSLLEENPRPKNYAQVLNAASSFGSLMSDAQFRARVLDGLHDPDADVEKASVDIILERFLNSPENAESVDAAFAHLGSKQRNILITEVTNPKFMRVHQGTAGLGVSQDAQGLLGGAYGDKKYQAPNFLEQPVVLKTVIASLYDKDANVRAAALDLLRKSKGVEKRQDFHAAVLHLQHDPNPRLQLIAANVLGGKTLSDSLHDVKPGSVLSFDYFVQKVEPILAQVGPDGKACVVCHASHAIFHLIPPTSNGIFSDHASRENYMYAMRVVDISDPRHSLILVKPTHPAESGGNITDYYASHNGGQRWKGNESSWEYKTILEWIQGAKVQTANSKAPGHGR
ncbi:MAG TPA: hypothetical protein VFZ08_00650, partial [Terriglobia bacterium]|nr:hypothetical protein [Terriglobia bacterium]